MSAFFTPEKATWSQIQGTREAHQATEDQIGGLQALYTP